MSNPRRRLAQGFVIALSTVGATLFIPDAAFAATVSATVRTEGGPLNIRSGPATSAAVVGKAEQGSTVTVACSVTGQYIVGTVRATNQWDRLTSGSYASHAYLSAEGVPPCDGSGPGGGSGGGQAPAGQAPGGGYSGTVTTGAGPLRMRSGPSTTTAHVGSVDNGSTLSIACQVSGESITGPSGQSRQWDRLANGRYVSHAYVRGDAIPACASATTPTTGQSPSKPVTSTPPPDQRGGGNGTVRTGDGPLRIRSGASTGGTVFGYADNGSALSVACSVTGQHISGTVRSTSQWDRLADGHYVSHAYVVLSGTVPTCPDAPAAGGGDGPSGDMGEAQFIAASVPGAQRTYQDYGVPASVTIAQAILESGWGESGLAARDHNFFGIKCWDGYRGAIAIGCHTYTTTECEPECQLTSASFRVYASAADSFRDHGAFLTGNSRYRPAFAYSNDADEFIQQVWLAGYATDPAYPRKVISLMSRYDLYRYDRA